MQAPLLSNPHPLFVGRCLLRDTVVPIPEPEDLIVNYIEPSHVVVQRCTGKNERDCDQCMKMEWVFSCFAPFLSRSRPCLLPSS